MATLFDRQQSIALGQADGVLSQPPTDTGSGCNGVDAEAAHTLGGDLVRDDAQNRELAGGEARGESGRHRAGASQQPASVAGGNLVGAYEAPARREQARAPYRDANGPDAFSDRAPALVEAFGQALGLLVAQSA